MKRWLLCLLSGSFLVMLPWVEPAAAFYVEGLMSGMSSTTVQAILGKRGLAIGQTRGDGSLVARYPGGSERFVIAAFCNDRLMQVQEHFDPKFSTFVALVEKTRQELGTHSTSRVVPAKTGAAELLNAVEFVWTEKETTVEVVFAEEGAERRVFVSHRNNDICR